jgi:hypothetical protein
MVEHARQQGYPVKVRTLDDWIGRGLIGSPTRRPTGRGSALATFSPNQARLFIELLRLHESQRPVAFLTNVPVWLWVHWGDDYVATPQARKALRTWAGYGATATTARVRATVRPLLVAPGAPKTTRAQRDRVIDTLAALVVTPTVDLTTMVPKVRTSLTDLGFSDQEAKTYATVLEARLLGVRTFRTGSDEQLWDDDALSLLRSEHAASIGDYQAAGGDYPQRQQIERACLAFFTFIGFSQRQAFE